MTHGVITTETGINRTMKCNADLTIEKYNIQRRKLRRKMLYFFLSPWNARCSSEILCILCIAYGL